ncbi:MAG: hypothetical protein R3Y35_11770 [Clostridia bacterium]
MINKIKNTAKNLKNRASRVMHSTSGVTQTTEVVLLIVIAVTVCAVFFAPAIIEWFEGVMTTLGTYTENIFKLGSTT